ncbi:mandelate racemase/muconate lactonizing enzyme family protein [Glycomyces harbinensis]|uniref:L-alanine-DL-glutamate epimerase n=1 Tax=Glycomyces harbinensis TaxID=58114 RepID=A0A1G7ACS6_9ACTN|nr:mandelate racemase/muconate lactonizing enzyme family protein [Glycomyces harbinensis]SDE12621.1 L-alanine-DL-glutamate epimerase [Glycomyces harbinensis]
MSDRVTGAEAWLIELPVERPRTDAMQSFRAQETVFVEIVCESEVRGLGYTYTIGTGGPAVLSLLRETLLPVVLGLDATRPEQIIEAMAAATRATTVGAITSLAFAAVDTAVWDADGHRTDRPLWRMAGGARESVPAYDTEGGWLHLGTDELVAGALAARDAGFAGVKIKVGKPHLADDVARLGAVRDAVGDRFALLVDANQCFTLGEAVRRAKAFEPFGIGWLEEPLPADDPLAHRRLAEATSIPVAVGESLYSPRQFQTYASLGAAAVLQPDVARVGGITPWLKIAHLAEAHSLPVAPHFLMELHVSLAAAVPNGQYVEHIPQLGAITTAPLRMDGDRLRAPGAPGLGIAWDRDAIERLRTA